MITVPLIKFENPQSVISWLCDNFGPPSSNNRWNLKNLQFIDFKQESDATFIILKFKLKE